MTDRISAVSRSANMRAIRSVGMKPEMIVRRVAYALGYRYRLHRKDLPGKPNLAFGPRRKVIFVHGCFWHQHQKCRDGRMPQSNLAYWNRKLARNVERDAEHLVALKRLGWKVLVVWACDTKDLPRLASRIKRFLDQ
jgi:DNA mismatch endonuclease, patch repair protein